MGELGGDNEYHERVAASLCAARTIGRSDVFDQVQAGPCRMKREWRAGWVPVRWCVE